MQNYQKIPRKFDFSTKNMSIFAYIEPQIKSRVYTAIRYRGVFVGFMGIITKFTCVSDLYSK